jgi:ribosomal protein S18 acetylase RimI-like enzyme
MSLPSSIQVRLAEAADAPQIARLNELFNGVTDAPAAYAARLTDPRRVDTALMAELDGQVVGFAVLRLLPALLYSEPYAELTELYVEEGYRRRGVGRALIEYAEGLAMQAGAEEMVILAGENNRSALSAYLSLGYQAGDLALIKKLL